MEMQYKYKVWIEYLNERTVVCQVDTLEEAISWFKNVCIIKTKQGYNTPEFDEADIEKNDDEWSWSSTRVPFYGSQGDPQTGEVTISPTSMTESIVVHLDLKKRGVIDRNDRSR